MDESEAVSRALAAPYTRIFNKEDDGGYSAWVLELRGVNSAGATIEEANEGLEDAMADWIAYELEAGHEIPGPVEPGDYSGRLTFRIPPSLHHEAVIRAQVENVSLNRLLSDAVSRYLGGATQRGGSEGTYEQSESVTRAAVREQEPEG